MDPDYQKFGRGPRELTGAIDLISRYKLLPHHNFFCKRSLHVSISDSHYLHNVVGDTEVRKGEGMQLSQLIPDSSLSRETNMHIQPFALDILKEAFQLKATAPLVLLPLKRELLLSLGNIRTSPKTRKRSIKTKIRRKSTRSTNISIKTGVKTRRRRKIKVAIRILVMTAQRDITRSTNSSQIDEMELKGLQDESGPQTLN